MNIAPSHIDIALPDVEDTDALGARLAHARPPRAVLYLEGPLGAGKSSLARALLRALGVQGTIRSPTYTLVERYPLDAAGNEALHLDLYRIGDPGELEYLGLEQDDGALWLVEWPDRGSGALPEADVRMTLAMAGDGRIAHAEVRTPTGAQWMQDAGLLQA